MICPDRKTFELAIALHEKLRYLTGTSADQQDLVGLLDDFIQLERIRIGEELAVSDHVGPVGEVAQGPCT